jgi:signal recognition particle receptor subunit beta
VAVNLFDTAPRYAEETLREALALGSDVPLILCDAREDGSVVPVLVRLVEHALSRALAAG